MQNVLTCSHRLMTTTGSKYFSRKSDCKSKIASFYSIGIFLFFRVHSEVKLTAVLNCERIGFLGKNFAISMLLDRKFLLKDVNNIVCI